MVSPSLALRDWCDVTGVSPHHTNQGGLLLTQQIQKEGKGQALMATIGTLDIVWMPWLVCVCVCAFGAAVLIHCALCTT